MDKLDHQHNTVDLTLDQLCTFVSRWKLCKLQSSSDSIKSATRGHHYRAQHKVSMTSPEGPSKYASLFRPHCLSIFAIARHSSYLRYLTKIWAWFAVSQKYKNEHVYQQLNFELFNYNSKRKVEEKDRGQWVSGEISITYKKKNYPFWLLAVIPSPPVNYIAKSSK